MKPFSVIREASLNDAAMNLLIFNFGVLMTKTYEKWDAYKEGIIDEDGEIIKEPETAKEKKAFGKMERFILKIKKTMLKYIKSEKLLSVLVYAYILKAESPNIVILELEEELSVEERNDLVDFVKGYYKAYSHEF
jgi:hypothetical protein